MLVKQQLQVINFSAGLGRGQAGNFVVSNIEWLSQIVVS